MPVKIIQGSIRKGGTGDAGQRWWRKERSKEGGTARARVLRPIISAHDFNFKLQLHRRPRKEYDYVYRRPSWRMSTITDRP